MSAVLSIDRADLVADMERAEQVIIAARFCPTSPSRFMGVPGAVTWAPDGESFVVECIDESHARWIGYKVAQQKITGECTGDLEHDLKKADEWIWYGTRPTPHDTFAAQFRREPE